MSDMPIIVLELSGQICDSANVTRRSILHSIERTGTFAISYPESSGFLVSG